MANKINLLHNDCLEEMKKMEPNLCDSIITDAPYGLKFMSKKWDYEIPSITVFQEMLRVAKPGAFLLCFGGTRTFHRMACNIEDAGWEIRDTLMWIYGSGFPKSYNIGKKIKSWGGYGTALKPAYEPIVLAMKSLDKNFVNNALVHGVSGLNIDGCRVETTYKDKSIRLNSSRRPNKYNKECSTNFKPDAITQKGYGSEFAKKGRWPANIILDEESAKMLDKQSGILTSGGPAKNRKKELHNKVTGFRSGMEFDNVDTYNGGNKGGASRFFYCAKISTSERNLGCERNNHPTVKPLEVMKWLCRLTRTPSGGLVLDPFMGSGTTGLACLDENRDFIGIELNKDYFNIAKSRIENYDSQKKIWYANEYTRS
jgi:site-specific DNA-methyltransferase (adenine-specific)